MRTPPHITMRNGNIHDRIQVNCYAPGIVGTRMWEASVQSHPTGHQEMLKSLQLLEGRLTHLHGPQDGGHIKTVAESATTLRRVSVPEDVANVVSFLSGSDSDFVTGQVRDKSPSVPDISSRMLYQGFGGGWRYLLPLATRYHYRCWASHIAVLDLDLLFTLNRNYEQSKRDQRARC